MSGDDANARAFCVPEKKVKCASTMKMWAESEAFQDLMNFLLAVNEAVRGRTDSQLTADVENTAIYRRLMELLDAVRQSADQTQPIDQPQRFGNRAFSRLHEKIAESAAQLLAPVLQLSQLSPADCCDSVSSQTAPVLELTPYLLQSFGDPQRIDYGTGHELAFLCLLCCLDKLHCFNSPQQQQDRRASLTGAVAFSVLNRYIDVVQYIQRRYRMEPAGSCGVWSLDDYQFVPFIWGSSQLNTPRDQSSGPVSAGGDVISPAKIISDVDTVKQLGQQYLLFKCVDYINQVKSGPFAEHSSVLYSMSGVAAGWSKINTGLVKMYKAEVLAKLPVIQHCLFGSLLSLNKASSRAASTTLHHLNVLNKSGIR